MKKLFFIYTIVNFDGMLYKPTMLNAFGSDSEVDVSFITDTSLLKDTISNNMDPSGSVSNRLALHVESCVEAGADCIVVGCTAMNTATREISKKVKVPTFNIDMPMIEKAIKAGYKKVAILSHAADNAGTITRILKEYGVQTVEIVPDGANRARVNNEKELFTSLMKTAAKENIGDCEALLLAHISSDYIDFSDIDVPVLKSGECCISKIREVI